MLSDEHWKYDRHLNCQKRYSHIQRLRLCLTKFANVGHVPVSGVIDRNGRIAFYEQSLDVPKLKEVVSKLLRSQAPPGRYKASPQRIGLWGQRLWPFEYMRRSEVFQHWGNGDVFSIALLREGRAQWTFGLMALYHKM